MPNIIQGIGRLLVIMGPFIRVDFRPTDLVAIDALLLPRKATHGSTDSLLQLTKTPANQYLPEDCLELLQDPLSARLGRSSTR